MRSLVVLFCLLLTGCFSLPSWLKPATPLEKVDKTEQALVAVSTKLNALTDQVHTLQGTVNQANDDQWLYVSKLSTGVEFAYTLDHPEVGRLLNSDIRTFAITKAPLAQPQVTEVQTMVSGLTSPLAAQLAAAQKERDELRAQVTTERQRGDAAKDKIVDLTKQVGEVKVRQATVAEKLTSETKAAIVADKVKDDAIETWNSIKLYFYAGIVLIVLVIVGSHLHLTSIMKTLIK
jgi:hypothetical protein